MPKDKKTHESLSILLWKRIRKLGQAIQYKPEDFWDLHILAVLILLNFPGFNPCLKKNHANLIIWGGGVGLSTGMAVGRRESATEEWEVALGICGPPCCTEHGGFMPQTDALTQPCTASVPRGSLPQGFTPLQSRLASFHRRFP